MDFVNRNLSGAFKIILTIMAVLIFIRILPVLLVVGVVAWGGFKGVKYLKTRGNKKANKYEKMDVNANIHDEKDSFDFTGKNVVDVEYEEIRK